MNLQKLLRLQWGRALLGLLALLVLGALLAPRAVSPAVLLSLLPFIGILGVASIGQHLVIQQRGFDLSVAGVMSLAAAFVSAMLPSGAGDAAALLYVVLALLAGAAFGLVNGLLVTLARIPSLVTTIGTNAALLGLTLYVTGGTPSSTAELLKTFAVTRVGGVPLIFVVMALVTAATGVTLARSATGRRFVAVGVNPTAADVLAIAVDRYRIVTYTLAGLLFALAGVMLGAFLNTPNVFSGNPYMLTTVAAVVIGGSPLNGDRGSLVATVIGAAFLVVLDQLVLSLGFNQSMQNMVQALIVLAGVSLPEIVRKRSLRRRA